MAEIKYVYLAEPRSPTQESEIEYVRDQARFYKAVLKEDPGYVLVPCCWQCSSDNLREDRYELSFTCNDCGFKDSSIDIRAGRIAR